MGHGRGSGEKATGPGLSPVSSLPWPLGWLLGPLVPHKAGQGGDGVKNPRSRKGLMLPRPS